ncbi:MAG TPA: hypothetical protein VFG04_04225 [Planctomycetaceae bacterium]|nr:hypothetical protein [Planctomycetaceae bacterium]
MKDEPRQPDATRGHPFRVGSIAIVILALYVASIGPAHLLPLKPRTLFRTTRYVYWPIWQLAGGSRSIESALMSYLQMWSPPFKMEHVEGHGLVFRVEGPGAMP